MSTQDENPFYRLGQSMAQQGLDLQAARETIEALQAELQQAREALKFQVGQKLKYYEALEKPL
jgi:hypothetical protein